MTAMPPPFEMREACKRCMTKGELVIFGTMTTVNGQDVVRCGKCGQHCYNAPRSETGKPQRKIKSREDLTFGQRERILERDGARCVLCGRYPQAHNVVLVIGHAISLAEGRAQGCTDEQLNDDANLYVSCEECNAGQGARSLAPWVMARLLIARFNRTRNGGIL
jgi:5-methylcytosine-specific restriction endonuclease McrA